MTSKTITITGHNNTSSLCIESQNSSINSNDDKFLQDFLNPNYFQVILPFNFKNENDFNKLVNFIENDPLYGFAATRSAKGSLHILGFKDKDTLMYQLVQVWDTMESWSNYINWRLTGDPTFVFQQLLNDPNFPSKENSPSKKWEIGYYDPDLINNLLDLQKNLGIYINIDRSDYVFNFVIKDTLDFIARIFTGFATKTNMPSTIEFNYSDKINEIFKQTGGTSIAR